MIYDNLESERWLGIDLANMEDLQLFTKLLIESSAVVTVPSYFGRVSHIELCHRNCHPSCDQLCLAIHIQQLKPISDNVKE